MERKGKALCVILLLFMSTIIIPMDQDVIIKADASVSYIGDTIYLVC